MRSSKSARQSSKNLKIGVTGHRYLTEVEKLAAGIDLALAAIARAYPGQDWTLLSPLAEGADRLVAWRALNFKPSMRLVVPLPLELASYRLDFATPESQLEFQDLLDLADEIISPPSVPGRDEGYYAAGKYVIEQAQVMVALWDGQPVEGRGGTGEIVELTRQKSLPLAWVHCANYKPGIAGAPSFSGEQGVVEFERLSFTT